MPFTLRCDVHVPTRTKTVPSYLANGSSHVHGSRLVGISSSYLIGWACAKNVCCTLTIHATHARCLSLFPAFSCFFLLFLPFCACQDGSLPVQRQGNSQHSSKDWSSPSYKIKTDHRLNQNSIESCSCVLDCPHAKSRISRKRQKKAEKGRETQNLNKTHAWQRSCHPLLNN